jgi:hypothetical protein
MGCLVIASVILAVVYFARRQGAGLLPDLNPGELEAFLTRVGLLVSTLVLIVRNCIFYSLAQVCGFFHFFGPEWLVGYQTVFFACIGLYGIWVLDAEHIFIVC